MSILKSSSNTFNSFVRIKFYSIMSAEDDFCILHSRFCSVMKNSVGNTAITTPIYKVSHTFTFNAIFHHPSRYVPFLRYQYKTSLVEVFCARTHRKYKFNNPRRIIPVIWKKEKSNNNSPIIIENIIINFRSYEVLSPHLAVRGLHFSDSVNDIRTEINKYTNYCGHCYITLRPLTKYCQSNYEYEMDRGNAWYCR